MESLGGGVAHRFEAGPAFRQLDEPLHFLKWLIVVVDSHGGRRRFSSESSSLLLEIYC
jgi:hypothetical protein